MARTFVLACLKVLCTYTASLICGGCRKGTPAKEAEQSRIELAIVKYVTALLQKAK